MTECSVVLGVVKLVLTCGGVLYCVVVIKMCVGVDVLVGILGVRWVLTYSVTYLVKYMVT